MLEDILVPIFVCVVLPVLIVFIVMWKRKSEIDRKAEVAMKALEKGMPIDNLFKEVPVSEKTPKNLKQLSLSYFKTAMILCAIGLAILVSSLFVCNSQTVSTSAKLPGLLLLLLGLGFLAYYFIFRKTYAKEIALEEERNIAKLAQDSATELQTEQNETQSEPESHAESEQ